MEEETADQMRERIKVRTEKAEKESQRTYAEERVIRRNIRIARKQNKENMKTKSEISSLIKFLEKNDVGTLEPGPYTVWSVLKWVLDDEDEEGHVGGGVWIRGKFVSLKGDF